MVVFVPAWEDDKYVAMARGSRHLKLEVRLRRNEHDYRDGMQHSAGRAVWSARVDSLVFFLFNQSGWDRLVERSRDSAASSLGDVGVGVGVGVPSGTVRKSGADSVRESFLACCKRGEDETLPEVCVQRLG